jgi:hypothetical protein
MPESLLLEADAREAEEERQLSLFLGGVESKIDRSKPVFHYTGERFFRDRPEIYRVVVDMLAEDLPIRKIERACHVSHDTIESVREREAIPISTLKKTALNVAARANRLLAERIEELAPAANLRDAVIGYGVTYDKVALATGDPTARVDDIAGRDLFGQLAELARRLTEAIGLPGENVPLKGTVVVEALSSAGSDLESEVLPGGIPAALGPLG